MIALRCVVGWWYRKSVGKGMGLGARVFVYAVGQGMKAETVIPDNASRMEPTARTCMKADFVEKTSISRFARSFFSSELLYEIFYLPITSVMMLRREVKPLQSLAFMSKVCIACACRLSPMYLILNILCWGLSQTS